MLVFKLCLVCSLFTYIYNTQHDTAGLKHLKWYSNICAIEIRHGWKLSPSVDDTIFLKTIGVIDISRTPGGRVLLKIRECVLLFNRVISSCACMHPCLYFAPFQWTSITSSVWFQTVRDHTWRSSFSSFISHPGVTASLSEVLHFLLQWAKPLKVVITGCVKVHLVFWRFILSEFFFCFCFFLLINQFI